jgi:hypothetical protein
VQSTGATSSERRNVKLEARQRKTGGYKPSARPTPEPEGAAAGAERGFGRRRAARPLGLALVDWPESLLSSPHCLELVPVGRGGAIKPRLLLAVEVVGCLRKEEPDVTGGPGGCLPRDLAPGAGAQWGNLGIAHVGARADRGDAGRRG